MSELRIGLSDDHAVVRAALRMVLEAQPGWRVVAESGDAESAARDVAVHHPDVLVLDLAMPGRPSLEVLRQLHRDAAATPVVILTMEADPAMARTALAAGASAYVLKESADEQLVQAIRTAAAGGTYLDPTLGAAVVTGRPAAHGGVQRLTARELDVLRLIALGHTNREIADRLGVSIRTVESHRGRLHAKTGRTSRAELVALARTAGLLDEWTPTSARRQRGKGVASRRSGARHGTDAAGSVTTAASSADDYGRSPHDGPDAAGPDPA